MSGKRKMSDLHLSLEDLKPHFGKTLNDVAEELGVGRSTIKRACRKNGIIGWRSTEKQTETTQDHTNTESNQHLDDKVEFVVVDIDDASSQNLAMQNEDENIIIKAVMDGEYEERVLPFLRRQQGWDDEYSISEFKHHLDEADLMEEKLELGWVLWHHSNHTTQIQDNIVLLLKHIASMWFETHFLVQFWAAVEVKGRHHYLSTSNQPFFVGKLRKGLCWYRKQCMDDMYDVVVDVAEITGRAYRNKQPESTPDLRLYSTDEFPLRDHAARCGLIGYLALPLFDLDQDQCYGVLELLSDDTPMRSCLLSSLNEGLQIAGLRSTHTSFIPISRDTKQMPYIYQQRQQESEITKLLKSCVEAVPQLHLAQVWVPCMQCAYKQTILCCMERATFINSHDKAFNLCNDIDEDMFDYLQASEFHNIQIDLSCLHHYNLCDISISKKPFSHYAERARLSSSFAICLESGSDNS